MATRVRKAAGGSATARSRDTAVKRSVSGRPTKAFFVSMLVRDIELLPAVVDLVDNSVNGARRERPDGDYTGLKVAVEASAKRFTISDNCGGMSIDTAVNYAFRFGRVLKVDDHSIGQFGVGMKRAIFKLGRHFRVTSRTNKEAFVVDVDVQDWVERLGDDDWDFDLEEEEPDGTTGTVIRVDELLPEVAEQFAGTAWRTELAAELRLKHADALGRGLAIAVNGTALKPVPLEITRTKPFGPTVVSSEYGQGARKVDVVLVCGLGPKGDSEAGGGGWYVFCNGRMVLGPERTNVTVWMGKERSGLPRYHGEYARFRGYAFFDADDASALPWTTTKVGVSTDAPIWIAAREQMREISKPVIKFLRDFDRVRDTHDSVEQQLDEISFVSSA